MKVPNIGDEVELMKLDKYKLTGVITKVKNYNKDADEWEVTIANSDSDTLKFSEYDGYVNSDIVCTVYNHGGNVWRLKVEK